ncbi:MAG: S41 family peptidase, partial [Treponema sp.]|nr:S41 family peptidase [Treponema sp.]
MKKASRNIRLSLIKIFLSVNILLLSCNGYSASIYENDGKISSYQYMKKLNYMFDFIQQNYVDELDPKKLYEGALKGMLDSIGDPYTLYLDENYMRDLDETTTGSFGGVGLSISKPIESTSKQPAYVKVSSPIEDTPGYKAGIQSGDYIIAIDGHSTVEMTMNEVLTALRGEVKTDVNLTILRGNNMKFDVKLTRALIEVPTVKYGMIEGTKIGYIRLIEFTPETAKRMQNALDLFKEQNFDKLIIDVRDNPGGLLTSATDIGDKFIDEGTIVSTKSRLLFENQVFTASKDKTVIPKDMPVVVLINNG